MVPLVAQTGYTLTTSGTLIASGGDKTSCLINKNNGVIPSISISCQPGQGGMSWGPSNLSVSSGKSGASTFQVGDIVCIIGMNATSAGVSMGSLGTVGVNNAVLGCSVNVRSGGPTTAVTSQVSIPLQTMVWP